VAGCLQLLFVGASRSEVWVLRRQSQALLLIVCV
jgi:hypothetical protein